MNLCFESHEASDAAIRRVGVALLDQTMADLGGPDEQRDRRVHEARKAIKRLRALLRLVRNSMPEAARREELALLADVARELSPVREAAAHVEAVDKLARVSADPATAEALAALRGVLCRDLEGQAAAEDLRSKLAELDVRLAALRRSAATWAISGADWAAFERGFSRTYETGKTALKKAISAPSIERYHEVRKRAKDHYYQLGFLAGVWPKPITARAAETKLLTDLLGDDHDLALLRDVICKMSDEATQQLLLPRIDARRIELRVDAEWLARRLYAERPRDVALRFGRYFDVWRREGRASSPSDAAATEEPPSD